MKFVNNDMYCPKCKKIFNVPVLMSVSAFMMNDEQKKKLKDGTLFKNFCPVCGEEMIFPKN